MMDPTFSGCCAFRRARQVGKPPPRREKEGKQSGDGARNFVVSGVICARKRVFFPTKARVFSSFSNLEKESDFGVHGFENQGDNGSEGKVRRAEFGMGNEGHWVYMRRRIQVGRNYF
jgi:hypothetical protein